MCDFYLWQRIFFTILTVKENDHLKVLKLAKTDGDKFDILLHVSRFKSQIKILQKNKITIRETKQNNLSKPVLVFQRITRADTFEMKLDFVKSVSAAFHENEQTREQLVTELFYIFQKRVNTLEEGRERNGNN